MNSSTISTSKKSTKAADLIPIRKASGTELEKISREGLLSLTITEMQAIQKYFVSKDRDPSDVELETIAQTWSEHCVHKTFKGKFNYKEENIGTTPSISDGEQKVYDNLLKDTVAAATFQLSPSWCLSVFKDNAGVIEFDAEDGISFKVETHNHPSALEPYGGAGTGIGGVIRDIMGCGLGGKPICNTDVFCFGNLSTTKDQCPTGALPPLRIAKGVVAGVRDYGNRMGIPTANGSIYFDDGYIGNPLVFCGTVGLMPKNMVDKTVKPGDLVVTVGGRTGRDGIHGATFSSAPLESGITSNVVQIGHSIMEKKVLDVLLIARDRGLFRSVTDCGAGGFSSAIGELGQETGVEVTLEKAPLKYAGLRPWEIWLSESQERMVLAVPPDNWPTLRNLFQQEDVEAVAIGSFTNDKKLRVLYDQQTVAEIEMNFLHDGVPKLDLQARWNAEEYLKKHTFSNKKSEQKINVADSAPDGIDKTLTWLLSHPVIASKESVIRQYDHEVQGGMVIKPLMGSAQDAPTDACVFQPKLGSWRGVGVSNGLNPEVGKHDPYTMALFCVDEAYRNLIAVGGQLKQTAILDNFCWGDSKDALELGGLVRAAEGCKEAALAYGLPFISGKDSFNNTWKTDDGVLHSIPPTLLVSAIGVIDDVRKCLSPSFKGEGNLLYLIGETQQHYAGSLVNQIWDKKDHRLPTLDCKHAEALYKKLQTAMKYSNILSCHDLSEGGLAVAAAEMAFGSDFGCTLDLVEIKSSLPIMLFAESPARFLVEVSPSRQKEFEQSMGLRAIQLVGKTTQAPNFDIMKDDTLVLRKSVAELKKLWKESLGQL